MNQSIQEWEDEFYELTKTMDGQYRPKLKLLIENQIALAIKEERERVSKEVRKKRKEIWAFFHEAQLWKEQKEAVKPYDEILSIINK